ncbi:MAG: hypothetical protein WA813_27170, partial [Beijerinckiaceae bacterium]
VHIDDQGYGTGKRRGADRRAVTASALKGAKNPKLTNRRKSQATRIKIKGWGTWLGSSAFCSQLVLLKSFAISNALASVER